MQFVNGEGCNIRKESSGLFRGSWLEGQTDGAPVRKIFFYLAVLNTFDAFITHYGLLSGRIVEVNVLMDRIYRVSPWLFLGIKLSLSAGLLTFLLFNRTPSSRPVKVLAMLALVLYTFVFFLHCGWLLIS